MEMKEMKVEIMSIETIKPSSPTPTHRRTHKLSFNDQRLSPFINTILHFYSPSSISSSSRRSDILKSSLSRTLTHFYPFAGRVKDGYTIDCNDQGVTYMEARVDCDMSVVLEDPEAFLFRQLPPCDPLERWLPELPSTQVPILAVGVNHFACGGMAICVCIKHVVGDGCATANFIKTWADLAINANATLVDDRVVCEDYCTSLFPPQDVSLSDLWKAIHESQQHELSVAKRFVFDGSKIDALRNEIQGNIGNIGNGVYRPTRVEAVSSLIWSAVIAAAAEEEKEGEEASTLPTIHMATITVNLRNRMNPPFPQLSIGNILHPAMVSTSSCGVVETNTKSLAYKMHKSISGIDDTYVRQLYGSGAHLNLMKSMAQLGDGNKSSSKLARVFRLTSLCRFPFYEADFGWGKPVWLTTTSSTKFSNSAILLDSRDGKGIEAWIRLTKQEMTQFEQHPAILAYASSNPTILMGHRGRSMHWTCHKAQLQDQCPRSSRRSTWSRL